MEEYRGEALVTADKNVCKLIEESVRILKNNCNPVNTRQKPPSNHSTQRTVLSTLTYKSITVQGTFWRQLRDWKHVKEQQIRIWTESCCRVDCRPTAVVSDWACLFRWPARQIRHGWFFFFSPRSVHIYCSVFAILPSDAVYQLLKVSFSTP
jgi:hypothetical protein